VRDDLTSTDAKPPSVVALHFGTSRSTAGLYSESTPPPAETPLATARIAAPEIVPDRPWSPRAELSASLIRSLHSYLLAPIDAPRYPHGLLPQRQYVASVAVAIDQTILSRLRQNLLRLIDGTRAILRLILIRVLSALSRHPDAINVALVLLAASRCFGHRTDPSDRTLPVLTSMSVVTGRLPAF
jgi:hypothetical protein